MTDKEKEVYDKGVQDAWNLAMRIFNLNREDFYMDFRIPFNGELLAKNYSYYDALKIMNKMEVFHIGDEVENVETGEIAYVLNPNYRGELVLSTKDYICPQLYSKWAWKRTGNSNPIIAEILGKDENN